MSQKMSDEIKQINTRIEQLEKLVFGRKLNQIQFPLDEMSKTVIAQNASTTIAGAGSFGTQTVSVVGGGGGTVTVPAQPSGTVKVNINGIIVELLKK